VEHSRVFLSESTLQLGGAVAALNATSPSIVARLAIAPFQDVNAYASPQAWLWLIPTDLYPKDEMFMPRMQVCDSLVASLGPANFVLCSEASMGHPNILGAQQIAMAIEAQLGPFLADWRRTLAATQSSGQ
jgi:hypothetical protein